MTNVERLDRRDRRRSTKPVLLATDDDALLGDVLRLAAAAGVDLDVAQEPHAALRGWANAGLVLVGADAVPDVAAHSPGRHDDVHVVSSGPVADHIFRDALTVGARDVVELPAGEAWLMELLGDVVDGSRASARTIGVIPGSGGAGGSTFAAALGQVGAGLSATVVIDLDPWGPGLGRLLGFDEVEGIRWDALLTASGRISARSLRTALPTRDRLALLTFDPGSVQPLDGGSVREVVAAAQRGADLVVLDLPRTAAGSPDGGSSSTVLAGCDDVVLVVHASVSGVASAARVAARIAPDHPRVGVAVRTTAGAVDPDVVADTLGLPLVATYPSRRRVVEQVDLGLGPARAVRSPLGRAARHLLDSGVAG